MSLLGTGGSLDEFKPIMPSDVYCEFTSMNEQDILKQMRVNESIPQPCSFCDLFLFLLLLKAFLRREKRMSASAPMYRYNI